MFLKARNHSFSRPRRGRFLALLAGRTDSNGQCKRQWLSKILGGPADFFFAAKPVEGSAAPFFRVSPTLYGPDVLSLPALRPFGHFKLHSLTLLQAAKTAALDCREMYEHILAILAADETITFGVVKPLHCSLFHVVTLFLFQKDLREKGVGGTEGRC